MYRSGIGYDIHRTQTGRPLVLGGVRIDSPLGLEGHSDADVVMHALCDALLGAAGLGDIGEHFSDSDPANKDADSRRFLVEVVRLVRAAGFEPVNVDVMILAEQPRLKPHKAAMRANLAEILGLAESAVNIKAGTNEKLDAIGELRGMACLATAMVKVS
ncbi:MAG: 2-C-methyl-D-erythritol 2,4-cyclodiphosphate synthase [Phycisphaerae bacterium]